MDIVTTMYDGREYKLNNSTPFGNTSTGGVNLSESLGGFTRLSLVQNLFDFSYGTLTNSANTAAFGLALWELTHETAATSAANLTVTSGNFAVSSGVSGLADGFLSAAITYGGLQKYMLNFVENVRPVPSGQTAQNLVTAQVIPLPAAGFLLFGALGALGFTSRRRKAAAGA